MNRQYCGVPMTNACVLLCGPRLPIFAAPLLAPHHREVLNSMQGVTLVNLPISYISIYQGFERKK